MSLLKFDRFRSPQVASSASSISPKWLLFRYGPSGPWLRQSPVHLLQTKLRTAKGPPELDSADVVIIDSQPATFAQAPHLDGRWRRVDLELILRQVAPLAHEKTEWVIALFVDRQLNLLAVDEVGRGDESSVSPDVRKIVRRGISLSADGFYLVHNHPSGISDPSRADVRITRQIRLLGEEIDLPLLDHFIFADGKLVPIDC